MKKLKIGIIGFGNIGSACAEAIASARLGQVLVYDKKKVTLKKIAYLKQAASFKELISQSQVLILAIKPQDLSSFLTKNQAYILKNKPLLISFLAGIPLKSMERNLPGVKIIRAMPNLGIKARESLTFIAGGSLAKKSDLKNAVTIFSCMGKVISGNENFLDKITALSGSGPGFVFYFMESFYQQALKWGFKPKAAKEIVIQTFKGAADLADQSQESFLELLQAVTSPGGTTEAGITFFKKEKLAKKIAFGANAAFQKAKKISSGLKRRKK